MVTPDAMLCYAMLCAVCALAARVGDRIAQYARVYVMKCMRERGNVLLSGCISLLAINTSGAAYTTPPGDRVRSVMVLTNGMHVPTLEGGVHITLVPKLNLAHSIQFIQSALRTIIHRVHSFNCTKYVHGRMPLVICIWRAGVASGSPLTHSFPPPLTLSCIMPVL
jgi:hypothetical protein